MTIQNSNITKNTKPAVFLPVKIFFSFVWEYRNEEKGTRSKIGNIKWAKWMRYSAEKRREWIYRKKRERAKFESCWLRNETLMRAMVGGEKLWNSCLGRKGLRSSRFYGCAQFVCSAPLLNYSFSLFSPPPSSFPLFYHHFFHLLITPLYSKFIKKIKNK